nr:PREDICTED: transcriptional regulator ATRX isoform X8 [Bemisia tabaci]
MAGVPSNIQVVSSASESEYESVDFNACHKSNSASLLDLVDSELARRFSAAAADSENPYETLNNKPASRKTSESLSRKSSESLSRKSSESLNNKPAILDDCSLIKKPVDTNANEDFLNGERYSNGLSQKSIDTEQNEINKLRSASLDGVYDTIRVENSHPNGHDDHERDSHSEDESSHIYENVTFSDRPEDEQTESLGEPVVEPIVEPIAEPVLEPVVEPVPQFPGLPSTVSELTFETWTTVDDCAKEAEAAEADEADEGVGDVIDDAIDDVIDAPVSDADTAPEADSEFAGTDVTDRTSVLHDDVFVDDSASQTTNENDVEQTEETSETMSEKKGKKKKNSLTESTCTTKTKKTKKTKKSEEKENISVMTNGHGFDENEYFNRVNSSNSIPSSVPVDDDLANICVRNLKQAYCSEANKSSTIKHEEPVPPSIPIKELRRSFGDLRKAFDVKETNNNTHNFNDNSSSSIKMKSSFSKFDQLTKKTVLHVRSSDAAEAQNLVQARQNGEDSSKECKQCGKAVFVMEQIKAEGHVWHKNCFRCKTCNKQLTVDTYSSHEGELFCKPHFRELFKPKAVVDDEEPVRRRKPELIIRENQPIELPPDVVRASDKPDLGLEELSSLDVKSRFQVFEKSTSESNDIEKSPSTISVKRSPSILSKLAKFQAKGMDVGVPDESLNGVHYDESESSSDENDDESGTVRSSVTSERPMKFSAMGDVKKTWEDAGRAQLMEERREERKQERSHLRSHLLMGKQGKMKELYEQAVAESEQNAKTGRRDSDLEILKSEKARAMRERFERGEVNHDDEEGEEDDDSKAKLKEDDLSVFEAGICKKSRSLFLEMDANVAKTQSSQPLSPISPIHQESKKVVKPMNVNRQVSDDIVKSSDKVEDVVVETSDISSKFKFFETYKAPEVKRRTFRITPPRENGPKSESPDREIVRDPNVVRADDPVSNEADNALMKSQTTSKMLSIFRQMEEAKDTVPDGPKPLKRFTPPPDYKEKDSESEEEESEEEEEEEESEEELVNGNIIRASDQIEDEFLQQSRKAAVRARALKEKFEHWEPEKQSVNNAINLLDSDQASIEPTKNLRARFESMKAEQPSEKPRPRVNRFIPEAPPTLCNLCEKKVYQLEKIETDGKIFHKYCFRCTQCHCVLRIESYTFNNGYLYCLPHFKQLFISKGNYDEGFGADPLQKKWAHNHNLSNNNSPPIPVVNGSH